MGLPERDGLAAEVSAAVLAVHRAVEAALDPHGVLDSGKVFTAASR